MCTLAIAWQTFPDVPVALAATRDEALDRPSEPPSVRGDAVRYLAPRDADAGGTWIGFAESGLVAAVTNRWLDDDRESDRSRGLLVADCLEAGSAEAALERVEADLDERAYDGFNLLLADAAAAFLLSYDGTASVVRLDPGTHVVGNVGGVVNGVSAFVVPGRRRERARERVDSAERVAAAVVPEPGESGDAWLDRASAVLADHAYGACLHGDAFGTRSFTRIQTGPDPSMEFADGPPCRTETEPVLVPAGFASGVNAARGPSRGDETESQF